MKFSIELPKSWFYQRPEVTVIPVNDTHTLKYKQQNFNKQEGLMMCSYSSSHNIIMLVNDKEESAEVIARSIQHEFLHWLLFRKISTIASYGLDRIRWKHKSEGLPWEI